MNDQISTSNFNDAHRKIVDIYCHNFSGDNQTFEPQGFPVCACTVLSKSVADLWYSLAKYYGFPV